MWLLTLSPSECDSSRLTGVCFDRHAEFWRNKVPSWRLRLEIKDLLRSEVLVQLDWALWDSSGYEVRGNVVTRHSWDCHTSNPSEATMSLQLVLRIVWSFDISSEDEVNGAVQYLDTSFVGCSHAPIHTKTHSGHPSKYVSTNTPDVTGLCSCKNKR